MKNLILVFAIGSLLTSCASDNKKTMAGAGIGAGAGAVIGGIVGNQFGNNAATGALVGAAIGAGVGGHIGHRLDQQQKELDQIAETKRTEQGLVSKLKSDILFDTGKSDLKPAAKANLKQMADIMKKYPEDVLTVKGYTDDTGSSQINEKLSKNRAEAVRTTLVSNGIPSGTIVAQGLGPAMPVADNKTKEGRAKNRRVEIEVTVDESKVPAQKK